MATCKDCVHYDMCDFWVVEENTNKPCETVYNKNRFMDQSRFLELPCKAGDTVYIIYSLTSNGKNNRIVEAKVERIVQEVDIDCRAAWTRIELENFVSVFEWNFDKVFLSLEEAEDALKRLNAVGKTRRNNE